MRFAGLAVVVIVVACGKRSESTQPPPVQPPSNRPVIVDAAPAAAAPAAAGPCVVRAELFADRVTFTGGGVSGSDVTALRAVTKTCTARLVAHDDVTFEQVANLITLIEQQGLAEVRLGEPLGQWMSMDLARVKKLWDLEPTANLIAAVRDLGPRLGSDSAAIVEQVASTLAGAEQGKAIGRQTKDRGLFEAVAQIVGLHRATAPVALDLLEQIVMPALQIDPSAAIAAPSSAGDNDQTGVELFQTFVSRASKGSGKGLLGTIPDADVSAPYADGKPTEIRDGDWVVVARAPLAARFDRFDAEKLVGAYEAFIRRWKRRDTDRVLVDTTQRALVDLQACVATAKQHGEAIVFRALPAPLVRRAGTDDANAATVVITKTAIAIKGAPVGRSLLAALPTADDRTIVIEADRTLPYGRIRALAAAIGTPGHVTFLLRPL